MRSLHPRQTVDDILREPLVIHGVGDVDDKASRQPSPMSASTPSTASAIRTSCPAASASASPSPAR